MARPIFSKDQLEPPSRYQLSVIEILEKKSKMKFFGKTFREAEIFIKRAEQAIIDLRIINAKLKREEERIKRTKNN